MILKFATTTARSAFLDRLRVDAPELHDFIKASYSQPTVVMVRDHSKLAANQLLSRLSPYLDADVKVFADVQFKVMPHSVTAR